MMHKTSRVKDAEQIATDIDSLIQPSQLPSYSSKLVSIRTSTSRLIPKNLLLDHS